MRFALSSLLLGSYPVEEAVRQIGAAGASGVEIWIEHLWQGTPDLESLRVCLDRNRLLRTVHAPTRDVNVTSSNPGIRKESLRQCLEALEIAADLGASVMTVHPGRLSTGRDRPEDYWGAQLDAIGAMSRRARELGVGLGVEIMECRPNELIVTPDQANHLVAEVGANHCGLTFDVAHAITRYTRDGRPNGGHFRQNTGQRVSPEAAITGALQDLATIQRLVHAHISNGDDRNVHLPLDSGRYDLFPVVVALAARDIGLVAVEGYKPGRDLEVLAADMEVLHRWSTLLPAGANG